MGNTQGIFQRVEKKYILSHTQYEWLLYYLKDRIVPDRYPRNTICNIYFDTPSHQLIRKSLEKPVYKEKLRFRTYGVPKDGSEAFVELKKKYKGIVYKRRVGMRYDEAVNYLYKRLAPPEPCQITREIDYAFSFYNELQPAMYLSYDRQAYVVSENSDLRVTFDSNITWREKSLKLTDGVWGNKLLPEGVYLMEIKIPGALPVWFAEILDRLNIRSYSFSKYGTAYLQSIKNKDELQGGNICA